MFTGLIQDMGRVLRIVPRGGMTLMSIGTDMQNPQWIIGESIAINGACLTLVKGRSGEFDVEISPETLQRTALGTMASGEAVNIERALRPNDRMGGHFITGHVDAVGTIIQLKDIGGAVEMEISVPETLMPLLVEKGSVAVDGVSLTVNTLRNTGFSVVIIPHTLSRTTLGQSRPGRRVNIETDLIGKYVLRYLSYRGSVKAEINMELLARHGFV